MALRGGINVDKHQHLREKHARRVAGDESMFPSKHNNKKYQVRIGTRLTMGRRLTVIFAGGCDGVQTLVGVFIHRNFV